MAIGKASDLKVYTDYYHSGVVEGLANKVTAFNGATQNTIIMDNESILGDYGYRSFFNRLGTLVNRRDTTSVSAQTPTTLTQEEFISVKLNRKVKELQMTGDAWRKIGKDPQQMSYVIGVMVGEDMAEEYLTTSLLALRAAIVNQANLLSDVTGASTTTMNTANLYSGKKKLGDRQGEIKLWIMHSKVSGDLIDAAVANKIYGEAGLTVYGGMPGTYGVPVLVNDNASLITDSTNYYTLGLTQGAAIITNSEAKDVLWDKVGGLENITYRFQAEHAYNLEIKGFKWDVTNGGANPTSTNVGTGSNWDLAVTSYKNAAGICIKSL